MFYMETVYLQMEMAANRERLKELRTQDEHDPPEARLARARSSQEDPPRQTGPHTGTSPNSPWRIERWRGAGW
jgi:hypothetical protein